MKVELKISIFGKIYQISDKVKNIICTYFYEKIQLKSF